MEEEIDDHAVSSPRIAGMTTTDGFEAQTHNTYFDILLLGDGNFSFSLALARMLYQKTKYVDMDQSSTSPRGDPNIGRTFLRLPDHVQKSQIRMTCTSFDTREQLLRKYLDFKDIFRALSHFKQVTVLHEINAWELPQQFPNRRFDVIIWNHPHLGVEDFRLHRFLMAHFFRSVSQVLKETGFVSVSLVRGQEARWDLVGQAGRERTNLRLFSSDRFDDEDYPGYECKRNKNGQSFKNARTIRHVGNGMLSYVYRFCTGSAFERYSTKIDEPVCPTTNNTQHRNLISGNNAVMQNSTALNQGPTLEFRCKYCTRSYSSQRGVKTHTRQVHELKKYGETWQADQPKNLACADCGRLFHDEEARWQHIVSQHSVDGIEGVPRGPLTEAEEMLDGVEVEFIPCEVCGQAVPSRWHMDQHLEMLKPLCGMNAECKVCHKPFIEHRALRQHLNFCRLKHASN